MKTLKNLSIILTLCFIFTSCAGEYVHIVSFSANGIEYAIIDEHTVSVKGYSDGFEEDNIHIPAIVEHQSMSKPYTVTGIKRSAFYGCTWLRSIHLPKTLEFIEAGSFAGCDSIEGITIEAAMPPILKGKVFENSVQETAIVKVPYSSVYEKDEDWSQFSHIVDLE